MTAKELYIVSLWNSLPVNLRDNIEKRAHQGFMYTAAYMTIDPNLFNDIKNHKDTLRTLGFKVEFEQLEFEDGWDLKAKLSWDINE